MAAAIAISALSSSNAHAGTKEYKVTWLTDSGDPGPLGFEPNPDTHGTMGINNKGQVCYGYMVEVEEDIFEMHAWVWLPGSDYGLAAGWHDIGDLTGLDTPNIARDLNEGGKVSGISGAEIDGPSGGGLVTVWTLDDPVTFDDSFGTLGGGSPWSGGHAINDAANPVVVGQTSIERFCGCPTPTSGSTHQFTSGFRLILDGSPTLQALSPNTGDGANGAFDINTPASGSARTVGFSDCEAFVMCGDEEPEGGCLYTSMDPMQWDGTAGAPLDRIFDNRTWARGVNDPGQIVGYGLSDAGQCFERAHYWSATGAKFNLGSVMPSGQNGDRSRAEAINSLAQPRIVGTNLETNFGILWEKDGADPPGSGDFVAKGLNDIIGCTQWTIRQAHDINDSGWIAAIATRCDDMTPKFYAVLLTPVACPADIDENGCVNIDDLLQVIHGWGDCDPCTECPPDIAGLTCTVDTDDYLQIVNSWCGDQCPVAQCCSSCRCEESFAGPGNGGGPPNLAESIDLVLSSDQPEDMQAVIIEQLIANWP